MAGPRFPPTSVIVVSRDRPANLRLCLLALAQQDHPRSEIVVVADDSGLDAIADLPHRRHIQAIRFNDANISCARNLGLAAAAGDLVAIVDDDAIALPDWLRRLSAPLAETAAVAATGFVRGPDGLSRFWGACWVDHRGRDHDLAVSRGTSLHPATPGRAIKTVGTNAAFRRDLLLDLGGFDPAYRYFLDETDLNMRIARNHGITAIVTDAEVIHTMAANAFRTDDRRTTDLFEIGASHAVFLRKHCPRPEHARAIADIRTDHQDRLDRQVRAGRLAQPEHARLMKRLEAGLAAGMTRPTAPCRPMKTQAKAFRSLPCTPCAGEDLVRILGASQDRHQVSRLAEKLESGVPVRLSHHWFGQPAVSFEEPGIWHIRTRRDPFCRFRRQAAPNPRG